MKLNPSYMSMHARKRREGQRRLDEKFGNVEVGSEWGERIKWLDSC